VASFTQNWSLQKGFNAMWSRILPFAAYMAFMGVNYFLPADIEAELWLYPIKTVVVLGLLVYFWSSYQEWQRSIFTDTKDAGLGIAWVWDEYVVGQDGLDLGDSRRNDRRQSVSRRHGNRMGACRNPNIWSIDCRPYPSWRNSFGGRF